MSLDAYPYPTSPHTLAELVARKPDRSFRTRDRAPAGALVVCRALQQGSQRGCRFVDQELLIAVVHLISQRGDNGARLALATRAQLQQPVEDRLRGRTPLRRGHHAI